MTDLELAKAVYDRASTAMDAHPALSNCGAFDNRILNDLLGVRYDRMAHEASEWLKDGEYEDLMIKHCVSMGEYTRNNHTGSSQDQLLVRLQHVRMDVAAKLILRHFTAKAQRDPLLHLLESMLNIMFFHFKYIHNIRPGEYDPEIAAARLVAVNLEITPIALALGMDPPRKPTSMPDFTSFAKARKELEGHVTRIIRERVQRCADGRDATFEPRPPQNVDGDPKHWTFRELVAVCDSHERPHSLKDPRKAYITLAFQLAVDLSPGLNRSELGNTLSQNFRDHCVGPALMTLEKEIRFDHGHLKLPIAELNGHFQPLDEAVRTLMRFETGPYLEPQDFWIGELKASNGGVTTPAAQASLERFEKREANLTLIRNFHTEIFFPALVAFSNYCLHFTGAVTKGDKPASDSFAGDAWSKLKGSRRAILRVLITEGKALHAQTIGRLSKNVGRRYAWKSLAREFKALQNMGYITMDADGYTITAAGKSVIQNGTLGPNNKSDGKL